MDLKNWIVMSICSGAIDKIDLFSKKSGYERFFRNEKKTVIIILPSRLQS